MKLRSHFVQALACAAWLLACGTETQDEGASLAGETCDGCDADAADSSLAPLPDAGFADTSALADGGGLASEGGGAADADAAGIIADASLGDASDAGTSVGCLAQLGDRGTDQPFFAVSDATGSTVFSGIFRGTMDLGGGVVLRSPGNSQKSFVAKVDRDCHGVFARSVGDITPQIAVTASGELHALVITDPSRVATIDFGLGAIPSPSAAWLVKMTPAGVPIWQEAVITSKNGTSQARIAAETLRATPTGGVVVAGDYSPGNDLISIAGHALGIHYGGFVAAFDKDGAYIAHVELPLFADTYGWGATTAAVDAAGSIFLSGKCIAGDTLPLPGGARVCPASAGFLAKLDTTLASTTWIRPGVGYTQVVPGRTGELFLLSRGAGSVLSKIPDAPVGTTWTRSFPKGVGVDAIAPRLDGGLYATGSGGSLAADFGGGPLLPLTNAADVPPRGNYVIAYATDGTYEKATAYRNVRADQVVVESVSGDLVVVGEMVDRADLGSGTLTSAYYASTDIVIVRAPSFAAPDPGLRPAPVGGVPEVVIPSFPGGINAVYANPSTIFLETPNGAIQQCAAAGCAAGRTTVYQRPMNAVDMLSLTDDALVVATLGDILTGPAQITCAWTTGSCLAPAAQARVRGVLADATSIFWLDTPQSGTPSRVMRRARGASTPDVQLDTGTTTTLPVLSDGVAMVLNSPTSTGYATFACPVTGCAGVPTLLMDAVTVNASAGASLAGSTFAFRNGDSLLRCATTGCAGRQPMLAAASSPTQVGGPLVDASNVYFATSPGIIAKCPLGGCPSSGPMVLATNVTVKSMTIDAGYVYWLTSDNKLLRIAK